MGLFSQEQIDQINAVAAKSKEVLKPVQGAKSITSVQQELEDSTRKVLEYFRDSPAILITSIEQLHDHVTKAISAGYCGIDTETTGLDRIHDTVVGCSLYYPGGVECYIPNKHRIPIFETYYKNQLSYEDVGRELQRFVDAGTKMIFANADFDLAMIYKDYKVNLIPVFYYDVITAWRCLKEDEPDNRLKTLVWKYLHGMKGDPKSFSDFFSPKLLPYCRPEVAKLYAANDAKITFELFKWQLPYVTKSHPKCQKHHLEKIADLVWNVEFPMVGVCAMMHRIGVYYDMGVRNILKQRYDSQYQIENAKLSDMVQEIIDKSDIVTIQRSPFKLGRDFNEGSPKHVTYLLNSFMNCQVASGDKATLKLLNLPVTDQILKVRALGKLLNSFIDKLPDMVGPDGRIHSTFKSIGADCITGDSLLLTDSGYLPLDSIFDGTEPNGDYSETSVTVVNINKEFEQASNKVVYYDTPTIKLNLRGGFTVEGTPNHPIICSAITRDDVQRTSSNRYHFSDNTFFKQLSEIDTGDAVYIPIGYNIFPTEYVPTKMQVKPKYQNSQADCRMPEYFTEDFAELLGIYFADGSMHDGCGHFSIRISNKDQDVISRTTELVDKVFGLTTSVRWEHTTWSTEFGNKRIECIRRVLGRGASNKYIPSAIMQSPKSVVCAFIRGTTLDSSYDPGRQRLAINYYRKDAAEFVHQALANMGILSGLTIQNGNYRSKEHYRLLISGEYYKQFLDIVGVVQSSKRDIRETDAHSKFILNEDGFYAYVESIEHKTNTVYDLTVPDTHSFIANGMVNHNTGRMSSSDPNVQQIPSHATDIRHQFRATPAMEKIDVCEQVGNTLQITLGSYDSVIINGGEQKDVVDLSIGDEIISVKGILKIREVNHQLPYTTLVFDSSQVEDHIKHITPPYVMMSSDYSQQEPKMLAYKSGDPKMIDAFQHNRDIYATIAGLSFNKPYEDCLEFYVDENGKKTDQVNKEGKERRTQAKSIVLGITYGRSTKTVGEQLFGKNKDMTEDEKTKAAQGVYDAVLNSFPNLDSFMHKCQADARKYGYVETILGRRRHIRDMQLKPYEFKAGRGYVNPDIDPLDPNTLKNKNEIPERVVKQLEKEFAKYKYKGQIYKRIKELEEIDHIRVVSNTKKITDATRQCVNSVIQGSAAELTKIAQLKVANNQEWHELGARILLPVHDELIAEVPIRNAKRAGELLGQLMSDAGSFLPFTISCDVTTTLRWYGLEYPCAYQKPSSSDFEHLSAPELQWVQYHLFECEYILPVFNDPDGKKPMGDAALGVNGIWSEDTQNAITDYCNRYHINKEEFIDHIESKVVYDLQKLK